MANGGIFGLSPEWSAALLDVAGAIGGGSTNNLQALKDHQYKATMQQQQIEEMNREEETRSQVASQLELLAEHYGVPIEQLMALSGGTPAGYRSVERTLYDRNKPGKSIEDATQSEIRDAYAVLKEAGIGRGGWFGPDLTEEEHQGLANMAASYAKALRASEEQDYWDSVFKGAELATKHHIQKGSTFGIPTIDFKYQGFPNEIPEEEEELDIQVREK